MSAFDEIEKNRKIANWIKEFRDDRLTQISKSDNEASKNRGKVIMHIIPLESFNPNNAIKLEFAKQELKKLKLSTDRNPEGLESFFEDGHHFQLLREGVIEWITSFRG
jgi:hypothetical protein